MEKLTRKKSHGEHVRHFLSKQTKIANGLATLTNLKTLLGHIANFLNVEEKIKKVVKF